MQEMLNCINGVVCFSELFSENKNHSNLDVVSSLKEIVDNAEVITAKREAARHWLEVILESGGEKNLLIGNKMPRYYLRLPELIIELDNAPAILCLRELRDVMLSYNNRAINRSGWHSGQIGLFAAAEQIAMLKRLYAVRDRNVLIVSNQAVRGNEVAVMQNVADFLAADRTKVDAEKISKKLGRGNKYSPPQVVKEAVSSEEELLSQFSRFGVQELFELREPTHVRDLDKGLLERIGAVAAMSPIKFIEDMVLKIGEQRGDVKDYFRIAQKILD